jgi:excisionase family DNA binding protein
LGNGSAHNGKDTCDHLRMEAVTSNESPPFVSVAEAALRLGVDVQTIRRWAKAGHLHAAQPAGPTGVLRIPAAELDRLAEGQEAR